MSVSDFSVSAEKYIKTEVERFQLPDLDSAPKEIRRQILKAARAIARNDAFGVGHKMGKDGPIEQGLGSWENPTQQSIDAYVKDQTDRRVGGPEAGFQETVRKMRARLAEVDARRKATAAADDYGEED
jgi:hypothetical protein